MRKNSLSVAVSALLLTLLTGLVSVGVSPAVAMAGTDEEMPQAQAGRYYLDAVCKNNKARARYQEALFPNNAEELTFEQARRRLPALRRASRLWADANYRFARKLSNPPAEWPASVQGPIGRYETLLLKLDRLLRAAASAPTARGWWVSDGKADKLYKRGSPSAVIRSRLDLPPPGRGC